MSYAQNSLVEAIDFNTFVGTSTSTTSGVLNTVWSASSGDKGYGQPVVPNVAVGNTVTASDWANLINTTANAASHQGTSITAMTAPSTGNLIAYTSPISTNLTSIYNSRLNAIAQGSTTSNVATYSSTWSSAVTFTHTVTFANGDAARYFFNAGGQLAVTCAHPGSTGIDLLLNNLASNVGTVVMSSPISGTVTIAATSYNGITKIGGGGNSPTISQNIGYYALSTANASVFTQTASTGPSSYLGTSISVVVKSNGTQGSNNDKGSVITIYTIWDEVPNGLTAATGTNTTVTARPPATTYISNTWGAITITSTSSGL
jgi:hypothetical protein